MTASLLTTLTPRRAARLLGHRTTVEVLVRIEAPDAPIELPPRPPLNLALVIDRSGSMAGLRSPPAIGACQRIVEMAA
ncbi:MAG: hypothetical protein HC923_11060, partial [Myxococcales bacterium]|nr:hypothetical protein [Myxococcales bacterium]